MNRPKTIFLLTCLTFLMITMSSAIGGKSEAATACLLAGAAPLYHQSADRYSPSASLFHPPAWMSGLPGNEAVERLVFDCPGVCQVTGKEL